jgi:non-specific protein-tyrosine kinase
MLALGAVFLIEYLDDTVKTPDQIQEDTDMATLGAIAQIKGVNASERLVTHRTPRDPISEAYRVLRTNLSFSAVDGGLHSMLVTSSSPGEGKSTTTANLAVVLAQMGKRIIVVDADLRRPIQHKIFEVPNNQGLTTAILDNQTPISYHIQKTKIPNLYILASGPIPPNPAELLNSQRMSQVLTALKKEADLVVFDTPPTLTVADASILAPQVDGCLLVVESGQTKRDTFVQATERLNRTGAVLFGAVMNRLKPRRSGYYYNYYYYHHYYDTEPGKRSKRLRLKPVRLSSWLSNLSRR